MSGSAAENEYQIHVHVVQCKHLVDRRGDMVARTEPAPFVGDPVVQLSVNGQDKHTSIVNNSDRPYFDQIFFWKGRGTRKHFFDQRIVLKVYDAATWRRDLLLGECELTVDEVCHSPRSTQQRQLHRTWLALTQPRLSETDEDARLAGFVQVTITALYGRARIPPSPSKSSDLHRFLAPVHVRQGPLQACQFNLIVRVFRAEDFRVRPDGSAPFVRLLVNGNAGTSEVQCADTFRSGSSASPAWNQELRLPIEHYGLTPRGLGSLASAAEQPAAKVFDPAMGEEESLREYEGWRSALDNLAIQLRDGSLASGDRSRAARGGGKLDAKTLVATHRMHLSQLIVEPSDGWPLYQEGGVDRRRARILPQPFWINFYGCARRVGGARSSLSLLSARMNDNDPGVHPTDFCGRLLVQMYIENPWDKVEPVPRAIAGHGRPPIVEAQLPNLYASQTKPQVYTLRFDLFRGTGFPDKVKAYDLFVKVTIGKHTFRPKPCSDDQRAFRSADGRTMQCVWNEPFEHSSLSLPRNGAELPDVIVSVHERRMRDVGRDVHDGAGVESDDSRIGFLRLSVKDGAWPFNRCDPIWMELQPDQMSQAWNDQLVTEGGRKRTGWLQFRMQFGPRAMEHMHIVRLARSLKGNHLSAGAHRAAETLGDVSDRYQTSAQQVASLNESIARESRALGIADDEERLRKMRLVVGSQISVPRNLSTRELVPATTHSYELRAYVYQARHLPFREHFSDPYVEVSIAAETARTRTVKNSCYPSWYQVLTLPNVELRLNPEESEEQFARVAGDHSRYADFITVRIRDSDPHAGDTTIGRFEVRLADCDIVTGHVVKEWQQAEDDKGEVAKDLTLDSLSARLGMRRSHRSSRHGRNDPPVATAADWWPIVPERNEHGELIHIRDEAGDMLMPDELALRAHGHLLVWFQLVQKEPVMVRHWDREWIEDLDEGWEREEGFDSLNAARSAHTKDQLISLPSIAALPNGGNIMPTGENCVVEFQIMGVRDLVPAAGRDIQKPYIEIDPGNGMDPTKRVCTRKCNEPDGENATHLESHRIQLRLPEDPLFCPTFQVRVYDFRDCGATTTLVGTSFISATEFLPDSWQWGRTTLDSRKRAEMLHEWRKGNPLLRMQRARELQCATAPMAKEAMHAELFSNDAAIKFRFVEIDGSRMDPRLIESKKSVQMQHFERSMKFAQLQYRTYVEEKRVEEEQSEEAVLGTHDFLEFKARKAKKRALGAYFNLEAASGSDVSKVAQELLQSPHDPTSIVFHEKGLSMTEVSETELRPKPPRLGNDAHMPRARGMAPEAEQQRLHLESKWSLMDEADRFVTGYQSKKPRDLYGRSAQFDPETGYPINPRTGNAHDPVLKMDIDPETKLYLNPDTNLPIDPRTGFAFDRHTGMMYDPLTRKAVVFNHRDQLVRLMRKQSRDVHGPLQALPNRRIDKRFEEMPSYRPPFRTFALFRGISGQSHERKLNAGTIKLNAQVLTSQRRHEDPTLTDLRAATLGTDNLYVVRVYVLHGFDMMGIVDPFLRESANLHGRKVRQPRLMSYDGDTCNLYLRVRIGDNVTYESFGGGDMIRVHWCTSNPDFFACLQLPPISLPGTSKLHVEVWDHQLTRRDPSRPDSRELTQADVEAGLPDVGPRSTKPLHVKWTEHDRLVGTTTIDLEDRVLSADWRNLLHKPVERRQLWSPRSQASQGKLDMFIDMQPFDKAQYTPPIPIETMLPEPVPFELRVIAWSVTELDFRGDYFKKFTHPRGRHAHIPLVNRRHPNVKNFYVRGTFKDCDRRRQPNYLWLPTMRSDTHFNVSASSDAASARTDGKNLAKVVVNWRFCWKINLPCNNPRLLLELCCRDTDEVWAGCVLNLSDLFRHARRSQRAVSFEPPLNDSPDPRVHQSGAGANMASCGEDMDGDSRARPFVALLRHPNHSSNQGKLHLSIEALPEAESFVRRAGQGRNRPNNSAVGFVPAPPGRAWQAIVAYVKYFWLQHRVTLVGVILLILVVVVVVAVVRD